MKNTIKKLNVQNIIVFMIVFSFPFFILYIAAWHLGYFKDDVFIDPCVAKVKKGECISLEGCEWLDKTQRCVMKRECTNIRSQQACSEGCTWDPHVRRYNSNLYGLCRPDFRLSVAEIGAATELRQ